VEERDEVFLIRESKKGNLSAFATLIRRYSDTVYRFAFRLLGDVPDAEDLCQEVFLHALGGIKKFEQRAKFSTWLYRITVNLWKNKLKKESHQGQEISFTLTEPNEKGEERNLELPEPGASIEELMDKKEKVEIIKQCLHLLTPLHKVIVILRDIEGRTYNEIAEIMDCPIGTVQSRLSRARGELRFKVLEVLKEHP